jgi:hypothetical protein
MMLHHLTPVQGKVHLAAINKPILVGGCGFVGVGRRVLLGAGFPHVRNSIIDPPIQGHDAPHGAHGNFRVTQQTPDVKLAGIRMALLQMIDVKHERQPDLPGRRLRGPAVVDQPGKVFGLEAGDPQMDCGRRDVQEATDAALIPALIIELDDLDSGVVRVGMAVVVPQCQLSLRRWGLYHHSLLTVLSSTRQPTVYHTIRATSR